MKYTPVSAGGTYEHRSWECPTHGDNVPFFRRYKTSDVHACVQCNVSWYNQVYVNPVVRVYSWTRVIVAKGQWLRGNLPAALASNPAKTEVP